MAARHLMKHPYRGRIRDERPRLGENKRAKEEARLRTANEIEDGIAPLADGSGEEMTEGHEVQPTEWLLLGPVALDDKEKPARYYVADSSYDEKRDDGSWKPIAEDVKNPETAEGEAYSLKRHLMKALYNNEVRLVS